MVNFLTLIRPGARSWRRPPGVADLTTVTIAGYGVEVTSRPSRKSAAQLRGVAQCLTVSLAVNWRTFGIVRVNRPDKIATANSILKGAGFIATARISWP